MIFVRTITTIMITNTMNTQSDKVVFRVIGRFTLPFPGNPWRKQGNKKVSRIKKMFKTIPKTRFIPTE